MTTAAAIAFLTELFVAAPHLIDAVEALIKDLKAPPAVGPMSPEVHAAMDPIKAALDLAARARG
jgi:hypothetical protein